MSRTRIRIKPRMRIHVKLWPKGYTFEGKRIDEKSGYQHPNPTVIDASPGDLELLIAEWKRCPDPFEQQAARSLESALLEWIEEVGREDTAQSPAYNTEESEHFKSRQSEEVPHYHGKANE